MLFPLVRQLRRQGGLIKSPRELQRRWWPLTGDRFICASRGTCCTAGITGTAIPGAGAASRRSSAGRGGAGRGFPRTASPGAGQAVPRMRLVPLVQPPRSGALPRNDM